MREVIGPPLPVPMRFTMAKAANDEGLPARELPPLFPVIGGAKPTLHRDMPELVRPG